ncbi:MAG TPA: FHA domain-containing protein [Vicinamibacteria bacterium]|nr:FHA domain-containing protein [Vicinamibacteria bacterium]
MVSSSPGPCGWLAWDGGRAALTEGEHVLGRAEEALISFNAAGVSRRHARLRVTKGRIVLEDLGSKNGTYVGGVRVSRRRHALRQFAERVVHRP